MASVKCEARAGLERSSSVTKGPPVAHINAASLNIGLQISVKMFVNLHCLRRFLPRFRGSVFCSNYRLYSVTVGINEQPAANQEPVMNVFVHRIST